MRGSEDGQTQLTYHGWQWSADAIGCEHKQSTLSLPFAAHLPFRQQSYRVPSER